MLLPGAMAENSIDLGTNMGDHLSAQARLCDIELTSEKIFDDFRDCPEVLEEVAALFSRELPLRYQFPALGTDSSRQRPDRISRAQDERIHLVFSPGWRGPQCDGAGREGKT